jgi:hypothetical protein
VHWPNASVPRLREVGSEFSGAMCMRLMGSCVSKNRRRGEGCAPYARVFSNATVFFAFVKNIFRAAIDDCGSCVRSDALSPSRTGKHRR